MGIFSKLKKTGLSIIENPTNLRNYADLGLQVGTYGQVDTHGVNTSGVVGGKDINISDALLGKKSKTINPDAIADQIRATQSKGIGELNTVLDTGGGGDIVRQGAAQATKSVLTNAQDARRNAQTIMARSGLKGSSLELASNRSIDQATGSQLASINAQLPGQIRNQAIQDAQTRINVGGVNQQGMNFNTIEGSRSGGLLGMAAQIAPMAGSVGQLMSGYSALNRENRLSGITTPNPGQTPTTSGGINSSSYNPNKYTF